MIAKVATKLKVLTALKRCGMVVDKETVVTDLTEISRISAIPILIGSTRSAEWGGVGSSRGKREFGVKRYRSSSLRAETHFLGATHLLMFPRMRFLVHGGWTGRRWGSCPLGVSVHRQDPEVLEQGWSPRLGRELPHRRNDPTHDGVKNVS